MAELELEKVRALKAKLIADGGLVQVTAGPPPGVQLGTSEKLAAAKSGMYDLTIFSATLPDGRRVAYEMADSYDDWRTYYYLPPDAARAWRLAAAERAGVTKEKAAEWLEKYSGCHGEDVYREVLTE